QNKTITIPPAEAYGEVNQSLIVQVPRSQFGNVIIAVGTKVQSSQGQVGTIMAATNTTVTVDFNPELAGQTLIFNVKVVAIKR
ncbi:MAG: peptidylprolyl isomerase, partial [Candidatus Micrarchaeota archaeon]|nr:peptidylprolyl isomerase [Candidatus Micrarchaeota archaeon]